MCIRDRIITHNLLKTENVWIFENCFRENRSNHSHHAITLIRERGRRETRANDVKYDQVTPTTTKRNHGNEGLRWNDPIEIINTNETTKTRRLKQAKPPKQAKTPNRWKQAWLNYRMQGHSLPYYWITKAAIVICLVQQQVLTNLNVLALNSI